MTRIQQFKHVKELHILLFLIVFRFDDFDPLDLHIIGMFVYFIIVLS